MDSGILGAIHLGEHVDLIVQGAIICMGFAAIAIIIERCYMILYVYTGNGEKLMEKVQRLVLDNNISEAVKLCNSRKNSVIYQVFKAALVNAHRPFDEIQDHVEVAKLSVVPKLQKRMAYLFTLGNVSTLLGLLGTVLGLVKTFSGVGALEASQKQALLSTGISGALNATALGLVVAVPCMLAYGFLFHKISHTLDEIEHYSARLLVLLRTGSEYYNQFEDDDVGSTEQKPKKANAKERNSAA